MLHLRELVTRAVLLDVRGGPPNPMRIGNLHGNARGLANCIERGRKCDHRSRRESEKENGCDNNEDKENSECSSHWKTQNSRCKLRLRRPWSLFSCGSISTAPNWLFQPQ